MPGRSTRRRSRRHCRSSRLSRRAWSHAGEAPGIAIGVVHDDAVVWLQGFGVREMGKPEPVDADTVFQIASMSKPISATVVASLVGKGVLEWGTRVADLNPAFALRDPYPTAEVTVRDFFNHRSGLPGSAGNDLEQIGYDRATVMERLRLVPPSSSSALVMPIRTPASPPGRSRPSTRPARTGRPWRRRNCSRRSA